MLRIGGEEREYWTEDGQVCHGGHRDALLEVS